MVVKIPLFYSDEKEFGSDIVRFESAFFREYDLFLNDH